MMAEEEELAKRRDNFEYALAQLAECAGLMRKEMLQLALSGPITSDVLRGLSAGAISRREG